MEQILKSDWDVKIVLQNAYQDGEFRKLFGSHLDILLIIDNNKLISYCTFSEKDEIQPTDLTPWIGFVYTFKEYRGNRYIGLLFDKINELSNSEYVYLSTNHNGLYEKYGFEFYDILNDIQGNPSRVYCKKIVK